MGDAFIAFELEQIAPLTVVLGNTDLGLTYKLTEVVELAGRKFLVHHIVNPLAPDDKLKNRLARERPDVVVFGHTHKRFCEPWAGFYFSTPVIRASLSWARNAAWPFCIATRRKSGRSFCCFEF